VQVRCDEGVAIHIGPKPCVCAREGEGEASAEERIGQPLSRESHVMPGADVLIPTEGDMAERETFDPFPCRDVLLAAPPERAPPGDCVDARNSFVRDELLRSRPCPATRCDGRAAAPPAHFDESRKLADHRHEDQDAD
jgi:hypothetical protein